MKKYLLALLMITSHATASDLTLYFIPSPLGLDWSSPSNLAKTALKNKLSFKPHFMGHVFVEINCGGTRDLAGMIGGKFDYLQQLLIEQRGLGILYHSFEGRLENKDDILKEIGEYQKTGGLNFVRFKLNQGQCTRVTQYLNEYRKNNVGRYYGLANRPRFGEGAGCSAFGASFPDVLNILDQDMREGWSQTVNIPLAYAGPPLTNEGVNLLKVILNASSWAKDNEKHQRLTFWEPDRMFNWVNQKIKSKGDYSVLRIEKIEGVVFDKSHIPAPLEPIWLQQLDPKDKKKTL